MRPLPLAVALLLLLALPARGDPVDVRDPARVGVFLDFDGCQTAPGGSCDFPIHFRNPYPGPMEDANLTAEVFEFATVEERRIVDATWPYPYPGLNGTGVRRLEILLGNVPANATVDLSFRVLTAADMPHGTIFSQGSYFLRFWLEFGFTDEGNTTRYRFASWGHFTLEQKLEATEPGPEGCPPPWCRGDVNLTRLGVDGLLADSAFGVREPFPAWPLYVLVGGTGFFLALGFVFYAEENPGSFPRVQRFAAVLRGRWRQLVRRRV